MPLAICKTCQKAFEVRQHGANTLGFVESNHNRVKKVEFHCPACGKTLWVNPSYVKKHRFCSFACRSKYYQEHPEAHPRWEGGLIEKQCPICLTVFRVKRSHVGKRIYCSAHCYMLARGSTLRGEANPAKRTDVRLKLKKRWAGYQKHLLVAICPVCGREFKAFPSAFRKGRRFCSKSCANVSWAIRKLHPKPNKPERRLMGMLDSYFPHEWKYAGDGSILINWYNPDFVNRNGKKLVIELFGDYWHGRRVEKWQDTELGKIMAYNSLGYRCLVIWEHELKDEQAVVAKIKQFMRHK